MVFERVSAAITSCFVLSPVNTGRLFSAIMDSETLETAEFNILENIYSSTYNEKPLRQRELARTARTSLGLTNSILKRLVEKGWITVKKLNRRNVRYAITLEGLDEIFQRSYRYFKRTIDNIVYYKDSIDDFIAQAGANNINAVLLIGASDLEFIIEHCCNRYGLSFLKAVDQSMISVFQDKNLFFVYAENIPHKLNSSAENCLFLSQLLLRNTIKAQ